MLANDYNKDGNMDLLLAGNSYSSNVEDGQFDAFTGLFLIGDGKGGFSSVPARESGFFVDGDAKGMAELSMTNGNSLILVAQNSGKMKVFENQRSDAGSVRLNKEDVYAVIKYDNGETERREFYFGSGYLSHSSRVLYIPQGVDEIKITSYTGKERDVLLKNETYTIQ
jgi:hypothetical protein